MYCASIPMQQKSKLRGCSQKMCWDLTCNSQPCCSSELSAFFFQAEDGIRDWSVTGVQTCALPISSRRRHTSWSVTGVQTCALPIRSEEHTSELQSLTNLVCRLLLETVLKLEI